MSKTCSSCGAHIPNHYRFCTECGAKVQDLCPNCGAPVSETKFCPECGFCLRVEDSAPNNSFISEDILDDTTNIPKESEPATEHTTINTPAASAGQQERTPFDVEGSNGAPAFESKTKKPFYKKWWFWLLTAVVILGIIGGTGNNAEKKPTSVKSQSENTRETAKVKDPNAESPESAEANDAKADIEEVVLFHEDDLKITAKELDMHGTMGPTLKLLIENGTDRDLTVQARNVSVNGYMIEPMFSADVAAGKKANDGITFLRSDLDICGIDTIADMEFTFHIFDTEDWSVEKDSGIVRVETSAAKGYKYTFDDSGELAFDNGDILIKVRELTDKSSILGSSVVVYIENKSDKNLTVQARDVSINGFMTDPVFSCEVAAGKHAIDDITFLDSDLEENEITDIENIELSFHIFNDDDWLNSTDTDIITIDF